MDILNVGYNYIHSDNFKINRPYGSGDYVLLVVRSKAYFIINNKTIYADKNSVIIFKVGTPQFYGALGCEYINDWLHFNMNSEDLLKFQKLGIYFDTILKLDTITISEIIRNMFYEIHSSNIHKQTSLRLYLDLILLKISEKISMPTHIEENQHYDTLYNLKNEIYSMPGSDWSIDYISKKIKLSPSYIQHLYQAFFGNSITSDIKNSRIEYSKYLLSSTNMTVNSISQLCGYNNDVHFMRLFKQVTGVTPSQFRKQIHTV